MAEEPEEEEHLSAIERTLFEKINPNPAAPVPGVSEISPSLSPSDKGILNNAVVVIASELLALPFCFNGADGIMSGDWSKGIKGFAVGLPVAIAGLTFPLWRTRLRPATQNWIRTDAIRWMLPVAFVGLFSYFLGPGIYQRAMIPLPPSGEQVISEAQKATLVEWLQKAQRERDQKQQEVISAQNGWAADLKKMESMQRGLSDAQESAIR